MEKKKDFFISYNSADKDYAEWIAWQLEEANYTTVIQAWDFRPGNDFILEMQKAASSANQTIAVLSDNYLNALYTHPEWSSAFADDPKGDKRKLIGVRVSKCQLEGMLKNRIYIDLAVISDKKTAKKILLEGVKEGRNKPASEPSFPGKTDEEEKPNFPGVGTKSDLTNKTSKYKPQIPIEMTDMEINDFIESAYKEIHTYFKDAIDELSQESERIQIRFKEINNYKFVSDIYIAGKHETSCKVWLNRESYSQYSQIGFSHGSISINQDNSFNEILSISDNKYNLNLQAVMSAGFYGNNKPNFDYNSLSPQEAAEYLWRLYISVLEYSYK